jgi:hypothetical protein
VEKRAASLLHVLRLASAGGLLQSLDLPLRFQRFRFHDHGTASALGRFRYRRHRPTAAAALQERYADAAKQLVLRKMTAQGVNIGGLADALVGGAMGTVAAVTGGLRHRLEDGLQLHGVVDLQVEGLTHPPPTLIDSH